MSDFFNLLIRVLVENILAIIAIVLSLTAIIFDWRRGKENHRIAEESNRIATVSNHIAKEAILASKNTNSIAMEANQLAKEANQLAKEANSIQEKINSAEYEIINSTKESVLRLKSVLQSIQEKIEYYKESKGCLSLSEVMEHKKEDRWGYGISREREYFEKFRMTNDYTMIMCMIEDEKRRITFRKNILTLACDNISMESLPILIGELDSIINTELPVSFGGLPKKNFIVDFGSTNTMKTWIQEEEFNYASCFEKTFTRGYNGQIITPSASILDSIVLEPDTIESFIDYLNGCENSFNLFKMEQQVKDPDVLLFYGASNNDIELVRRAIERGADASVSIYDILLRYKDKLEMFNEQRTKSQKEQRMKSPSNATPN